MTIHQVKGFQLTLAGLSAEVRRQFPSLLLAGARSIGRTMCGSRTPRSTAEFPIHSCSVEENRP